MKTHLKFQMGIVPLFLVLGFSCSSHLSPSEGRTQPKSSAFVSNSHADGPQIALSAQRQTFHPTHSDAEEAAKVQFKNMIHHFSGIETILLPPPITPNPFQALVEAAKENTKILLRIIHPAGTPNGFVSVSAQEVESMEILGETAFPRKDPDQFLHLLVDWFLPIANQANSLAEPNRLTLANHLVSQDRCKEVVELLDPQDPQQKPLFQSCREKLLSQETPLANVPIYINTRNTPLSVWSLASHKSGLISQLQNMTDRSADLIISCEEDCLTGKIQFFLELPFSILPRKKIETLASSLLQMREIAFEETLVPPLPLELTFSTPEKRQIRILVSGTVEGPKLTRAPESAP